MILRQESRVAIADIRDTQSPVRKQQLWSSRDGFSENGGTCSRADVDERQKC